MAHTKVMSSPPLFQLLPYVLHKLQIQKWKWDRPVTADAYTAMHVFLEVHSYLHLQTA